VKRAILFALALALAAGCSKTKPKPAVTEPPVLSSTTAANQAAAIAAPVPSPDEPWRQKRPEPGAQPSLSLPVFKQTKLANGLTILVSESRSLPIVSFVLVSRGGSSLDPPGKGGLVSLAFAMLDEGAGGKTALEFSDALADLGASFSTSASQDSGTLSMSGLSRNADPMLGLLADVVLKPRLDAKDFDRTRKQTLANLIRAKGSAEGLAFERIPPLIYGADHPYGHPTSGTEKSVGPLTLAEVKSTISKTLVPGTSALIVAGDLGLDEAKALAEKHLGKWRGNLALKPNPPVPTPKKREQITIVHKPDSPQTMVVIGRPVFGRGHPDEPALVVANEVYGGSFASRLNMNLREGKGYTYGAHSTASLRRGVGALFAYAKVRADVTGPSVREFFSELEGLAQKPPSSDEIARAKDGLVRSLPGEFERITAIAAGAGALFLYDLPLDYFAQHPARIRSVSEETVVSAARIYFAPDPMQLLLVGDSALIQKEVEALNLGKVVVDRP
jgi:zinc protease